MCTETRNYLSLCHHKGWSDFDYCKYAYDTHDTQGKPIKKLCYFPETKAFEVPGLCRTCGERALKAEREAIAARERERGRSGRSDRW
jgi:hypothetical protein